MPSSGRRGAYVVEATATRDEHADAMPFADRVDQARSEAVPARGWQLLLLQRATTQRTVPTRILLGLGGDLPTRRLAQALDERVGPIRGRDDWATTGAVHILRHTFCSHLAMQGAPGNAIQELAGHLEMSVTQGYMHLTPDALGASIQLLDRRPRPVRRGDIVETASAQNGS